MIQQDANLFERPENTVDSMIDESTWLLLTLEVLQLVSLLSAHSPCSWFSLDEYLPASVISSGEVPSTCRTEVYLSTAFDASADETERSFKFYVRGFGVSDHCSCTWKTAQAFNFLSFYAVGARSAKIGYPIL